MTTIGRDIARHSLYPDSYIPRRVSLWAYWGERVRGAFEDVRGHLWFWALVLAAFVWLVYHFVHWALTVPGATRLGQ